jgi:hypothetical protein
MWEHGTDVWLFLVVPQNNSVMRMYMEWSGILPMRMTTWIGSMMIFGIYRIESDIKCALHSIGASQAK